MMSPGIPLHAVRIKTVKRRMRGGSQAHLVEGDDGASYVVKFLGNPQGTRTLINELICYELLNKVGACTPAMRIVYLSDETSKTPVELIFETGYRQPIVAGLHLGSRCPVNPETTAIYDLLPSSLLSKVINRDDFTKVLIVDLFTGQEDTRQAIFVREKARNMGFSAYFIDHGQAFGGTNWRIRNSFTSCLYHWRSVYADVDKDLIQNVIATLKQLTMADFQEIIEKVPFCWWDVSDREAIMSLWRQLEIRKLHLNDLVNDAISKCRTYGSANYNLSDERRLLLSTADYVALT